MKNIYYMYGAITSRKHSLCNDIDSNSIRRATAGKRSEKQIPPNLIRAKKAVYQDSKGIVRLNGNESELFRCYKGVKQGDSLSPLIFIICMDDMERL